MYLQMFSSLLFSRVFVVCISCAVLRGGGGFTGVGDGGDLTIHGGASREGRGGSLLLETGTSSTANSGHVSIATAISSSNSGGVQMTTGAAKGTWFPQPIKLTYFEVFLCPPHSRFVSQYCRAIGRPLVCHRKRSCPRKSHSSSWRQ